MLNLHVAGRGLVFGYIGHFQAGKQDPRRQCDLYRSEPACGQELILLIEYLIVVYGASYSFSDAPRKGPLKPEYAHFYGYLPCLIKILKRESIS